MLFPTCKDEGYLRGILRRLTHMSQQPGCLEAFITFHEKPSPQIMNVLFNPMLFLFQKLYQVKTNLSSPPNQFLCAFDH